MPSQELTLIGTSKAKILTKLLAGGKTAPEIASELGIQTSAARKHLEDLQADSIVKQEFRRVGVGRPKKFYSLTDNGKELFPRRYDTVLSAVLAKLVKTEGSAKAESILNGIAEDLARTMNGKGSGKEHIAQISNGLNELGFQASIKEDRNSYAVISENCPLLKTATEHSELVCKGLHETLLKEALGGGNLNRENWILSGDRYCKHVVPKPRSRPGK